jgi:hypothetical protein
MLEADPRLFLRRPFNAHRLRAERHRSGYLHRRDARLRESKETTSALAIKAPNGNLFIKRGLS